MSVWQRETAGYALLTTPAVSGHRSMPNASQPRPCRRPGRGPETVPANANGDARSGGPSVGSPQINSACVPETTSHDLRGRVQGIHPLHGSPLP